MNKKGRKVLASAALMSLVLTTVLSVGPVKADDDDSVNSTSGAAKTVSGQVKRIGEGDRYATAAKVATTNWTTSDTVVLVSGEGYADAVNATILAKKLDAPILLTTAGVLNKDTEGAISTLKAKTIYIVGGKASVSQDVRTKLKANYTLVEIGGANRYETNVAVAEKLVELGVDPSNVMMVGGNGFSDALSVAPIAAAKGQILLLGGNDANYMKPALNFINKNKSKVTVVGSKGVINDEILNSVKGTRVDGGKDRWDTNLKVLAAFKDSIKADKLYVASSSFNAKDDGYADALVASALAGKTASPLVLVDKEGSTATTNAISYIKNNVSKTTDLNVVGGTGVVSKETLDALNKKVPVNEAGTGEATVKSIEAISINQFVVHFNTAVNSDAAENVRNYKIEGIQLTATDSNGKAVDENSAAATAPDGKTVIITLAKPRKQYDKVKVSVKKGILTSDKKNSIADFDQEITFSDTKVPTLKSVTAQGNHQITIEFSEAVNLKDINSLKSKLKIDGQSISNYGINGDSSLTKIKIPMIVDGKNWAKKAVFYFDSSFKSGKHTLKVLDGDKDGLLSDAAGFLLKEETKEFQIESKDTKPVIKSVKENTSGEIFITFDRSMDLKTGKDKSNYEVNGKKLTNISGASISTSSNDTIIKLKNITDGTIQPGSNTVYISNKVKDAYRNTVSDDTRVSFDSAKDEKKPTVTKVSVIDSETIRVQFNKNVNYSYAKNISSYKLEDNKGVNITDHIAAIYNSKTQKTPTSNIDLYDIKLIKTNPKDSKDDWRLTGSKYNLTIKNIIDTASTPNTMDDYTTTLTGTDSIAPKVTGVYYKQNNSSGRDQVVVYFSEAMDSDTLTKKDNYKFVNGEGETKTLPEETIITVGGDNKSATVELPLSYHVKTADVQGNVTNTGISNDVLKIIVSNVKDQTGNALDSIAYTSAISVNSAGAQVEANKIKLYYDGDDLKADVKFNKTIHDLNTTDFTLGGVVPSSGSVSGDKVTLIFKEGDLATAAEKTAAPAVKFANGKANNNEDTTKIDIIKAQGQKAYLGIKVGAKTTDETGATISSLSDALNNKQNAIYDYEAAPKTTSNYWTATKRTDGGKIYLTFDTVIYQNSSIKNDDFMFTAADGTNLKADSISVNGNTVVFTFNNNNKNIASFSNKVTIRVNSSVAIIAEKDADGNYAKYTPSSDDLKERTVTITNQ